MLGMSLWRTKTTGADDEKCETGRHWILAWSFSCLYLLHESVCHETKCTAPMMKLATPRGAWNMGWSGMASPTNKQLIPTKDAECRIHLPREIQDTVSFPSWVGSIMIVLMPESMAKSNWLSKYSTAEPFSYTSLIM